ncbi:MAG: hypothetical protein IT364_07950 [Candidatus Hydrogenedentes bacterium]|nr:hypothetical protein [Candidatus Hydrogenedentota bacterium]
MIELGPGIIGGISGALGVSICFYLFKKVPGLRVQVPEGAKERLPELRKTYGKWMALAAVLYILVAAAIGLLLFMLFVLLNGALHSGRDTGEYYFRLADFVWALPSLFLAIIIAAVPCEFLMRWFLGGRFAEFELFSKLNQGFDSTKLAIVMSALIVIVVAIAIPLGFDYYTRINDSGMDINSLFSFGTHHRDYSEIRELREVLSFKAPAGNIVRDPYHELEFNDGKTWSFRDNVFQEEGYTEKDVFQYLSEKSGIPITAQNPFPLD